MRLFIAINFTPDFRQAVMDAAENLYRQIGAGQITSPENLHITLAFLGETERLTEVKQAMQEIRSDKIKLTLAKMGKFHQKDSELYWIGLKDNPALIRLAETLCEKLRQYGFSMPRRDFQPHITIVRRVPTGSPAKVAVPPVTMTADRISLMKSERINGKLTYTEIFKWRLGG